MARIIIDAGHGGEEPGAVYEGRREKDDTLRLALAVGNILERKGVDVVYTRTGDIYDTPLEKAQMGNRAEGDYFVSIHRNAMPVPGSASGVESLVYNMRSPAVRMAESINRALEAIGFVNLGIRERPNLVVLRRTAMPAVLVEAGFLDNEEDNRLFDDQFNQAAEAIAEGIMEALKPVPLYSVQTGAYKNMRIAQDAERRLESEGFPVHLVFENGYYKVRVSAFRELDNAVNMEKKLKAYGYDAYIVRV